MRNTLGTAAVLLAAASALAQAPIGPEFRVNTYTTGMQTDPSVAVAPSGAFVVVWATSSGSVPTAVAGQRFDAAGGLLGGEFLVSDVPSNLSSTSISPRVAADASGAFVVTWTASDAYGIPDVRARRFDANGVAQGPSFTVRTSPYSDQRQPAIAMAAGGAFVVAWSSEDDGNGTAVAAQRFDAGGNRLGGQFVVNRSTWGFQFQPDVALDAAGNFVIVWTSETSPRDAITFAQRFDAAGARIGSEFFVSATTAGRSRPRVAMADDGSFVVVWQDFYAVVHASRYDPAGTPRDHLVVAPFEGYAAVPAVVPGGGFVVAWTQGRYYVHTGDGSDSSIMARRFDADGSAHLPFQVNSSINGRQAAAALGADAAGHVVVAWASEHEDGGLVNNVFAQRHGLLEPRALAVDTAAGPLSNGNGVLDPGEQVDLRPSWANNAAGTQSLAGAVTTFSGPPGAGYLLVDGTATYGTVPPGGTQTCSECYAVSVTPPSARPALHWDATATEMINPGDDGHFAWTLHVGDSFSDVPRSNAFYRFVETLLHRRISAGCGGGSFCPADATTRAQMAPFLLTSKEGAGYYPRACRTPPLFADVLAASPSCRWIEELARRGVTGGCGGGNYCPNDPVTRDQMAVFLLRTVDPLRNPPGCTTPMFNDVPASSPFCRWIEELARRGITAGCGGGSYCPTRPVTREQMAVFLTTTFGLTLYGP